VAFSFPHEALQKKKRKSMDQEIEECQLVSTSNYSSSLHFLGLAVILLVSGFSIILSLYFGRRQSVSSTYMRKFFTLCKMFGIGVIAGTAWVHLIPEATEGFESPCLGEFWKGFGSHWTGVFALFSTFLVQQIELGGSHSHATQTDPSSEFDNSSPDTCISLPCHLQCKNQPESVEFVVGTDDPKDCPRSVVPIPSNGPKKERPKTISTSTWILELGILSHSLIIGVTLGLTPDSSFYTLLIALSIHQFFEGLALGLFLADSVSGSLSWKKTIQMGVLYPFTTPLGICFGMLGRAFLQGSLNRLILTLAICDSLSSGVLIYNTYCGLFGDQINHSSELSQIKGFFRIACFGSLYLGAGVMAMLANWA
jgi:zinc transporter 1/2/3